MNSSALVAGLRHLRGRLAAHECREDSDEQLLHAFTSRRDDGAFAAIVRRHGPMVLNVCRRVLDQEQDAEDAFQATFLVLAQNAATLQNKASLSSFLHGIAYRTAMKAKQTAAWRRRHEVQAPSRLSADPADELSWREVRILLDEEIARLPEIYRVVFVLFYLEHLSREETARRLGLKDATVAKRLAEARKRLAQRLARRGVELTAVLAASVLAVPLASALPCGLMSATVEAALAMTTGEKWVGVVSGSVAELVKGMTTAMMASKVKIAAVVLLAVTLVSGAGVWFAESCMDKEIGERRGVSPPVETHTGGLTPRRSPEEASSIEIQGRVFGPDGKAKTGAKILLLSDDEKITELGVTAADGRFAVAVPKQAKGRLIARTEDTGIDFVSIANWKPEKPVELRLVKDRPIRGHIVTTEGKPVVGARVAVRLIQVYANNSLDSFLIAWAKRRGNSEMPGGVKSLWPKGAIPFAFPTDAEGRFVIRGIGAERVLALNFSGPGIASTERWIVNRDGFDAKPYNQDLNNYSPGKVLWGPWTLMSGPDVSLVAEHEKILRGIVKDADTGKGVAGAAVWQICGRSSGKRDLFRGLLALPLETRTDAEGRYEIRGALKAKSYELQVMRDRAAGYLGNLVRAADDAPGFQPLTVDLTVRKGVIVTGRVIDKSTGKPVPGYVENAVLKGNPFAKNYPRDSYGTISLAETGKDGTFREVVVPGPVLLLGNVDLSRLPGGEAEQWGYKKWIADPKYPKYFQRRPDGDLGYFGLDGDSYAFGGNSCKVVDAKPGTVVIHQDLFVERESARTVKIQDAEGQPLSRAWAAGLRSDNYWPVRLNGDSCPVYALEAGKPRLMVFYEPSKKLVGSLRLTAEKKEPAVAKLAATGAIRGRLLDADGKPLPGVVVDARYRDFQAIKIHEIIHKAKQAVTAADGSFTLDELIPELNFELSFYLGKRRFQRETKPADSTVRIKASESRDLGAIQVERVPERKEE